MRRGMQEVGCVPHPTRRDGPSRCALGEIADRSRPLRAELW